jgi:hypothetical protein
MGLKKYRIAGSVLAATLLMIAGMNPGSAQNLDQVGSRQCAPPDGEIHDDLSERGGIVGCLLFCTVDKSQIEEYEDFPGLVFTCEQFQSGAQAAVATSGSGLSGSGAIGALVGLGLLLGLAGSGGGNGSTNSTN